jgi:hypothetical protein
MSRETEQAEYISNSEYVEASSETTKETLPTPSVFPSELTPYTVEVTLIGYSKQIVEWIHLVAKGEALETAAEKAGIVLRIEQAGTGA